MDFLEKLNYLMEKKHLNKSTLSKACNIPYTTIDGWYKKGYEGLKLTTLRKLAEFFGTSLDYWASEDNELELTAEKSEILKKIQKMPDDATTEGEMFKSKPSDALEQLAQEYHLSNADYILISKFISLRPELRNKLFDFFREVISTVDAENSYEKTYTEVTEEETTAAAEAAYRKSLHSAKNTVSIVSSTIEGTGTR